ncbi:MAG TPA: biotin/lipoate A/B protein ligase family protein [Candidatus Methanoperedens sp.]
MKWRIIELETCNAAMNMALDEVAGESVRNGSSRPTIRFYSYEPCAVSIGYFQGIKDEVNLDVCRELGIDCVRRFTGGGAVYHDSSGEITYCIAAPLNMFPKNIVESYRMVCGCIVRGLGTLGIAAQFRPVNDILVGNRKISGSAQTRKGGVLIQHGTLLYDLDLGKMFSVLNVSRQKISDKMIKDAKERVTCILQHRDVDKREVYEALVRAFSDRKDFEFGEWSEDEMNRAAKLAVNKYRNDEWTYLR